MAAMGWGRAGIAERVAAVTVVLAVVDADLRQRLREQLEALRWEVREAGGGAEAMARLDHAGAEALVVDSWLPDLEVQEFAGLMRRRCISGDGDPVGRRRIRRMRRCGVRGAAELVHSLRVAQTGGELFVSGRVRPVEAPMFEPVAEMLAAPVVAAMRGRTGGMPLPDVIGESAAMRELARLVRLVAPRKTPVLIEGETGTGKEPVARAVHRLSARAGKPYVVLNCAAIPETLLEAELFGHTRGAFTGAERARMGRIEAAHGGTLFLDEIGEMPIGLQAKMLRFLESGEIQRIGGNETLRVDVRIVAATHQPLKQRTGEQAFRLDLYHRLTVVSGMRFAGAARTDRGCAGAGAVLPGTARGGDAGEAALGRSRGAADGVRLAGKRARAGPCAGARHDSGGGPAGDR